MQKVDTNIPRTFAMEKRILIVHFICRNNKRGFHSCPFSKWIIEKIRRSFVDCVLCKRLDFFFFFFFCNVESFAKHIGNMLMSRTRLQNEVENAKLLIEYFR